MSDSAAPDGSRFQMMHTMVRVKDLDKSIDFYTRLLGMTLLRKMDFPDGEFTLAFVGYGPEETHAVIELTYMIQVNEWFTFQPDLQYIINPGGAHQYSDAFVLGFQSSVQF